MAEDETPETTPETPAAEAPVEETPAAEAEATEAAPAEETPEAAAEEAPEAEAPAPAPKAEPVPQLTPKERKLASRARRGPRRPSTPEERDALRKEKAAARARRRLQEREKAKATRGETPPPTPPTEKHAGSTGSPKVRQGVVTSSKADKTITVRVDSAKRHRKYQKIVRSSITLHAHDETNDAGAGDTVRVIECRPLSRTKRWRLVEILERAK